MTRKAKTATRNKKPQAVMLVRLRDRIYAHLLGCERGDAGLLENVRNTTIADLARAFDMREATMRREVNRLVAAGGAGLLGDQVFLLPGCKMQPVPAKAPRKTSARTSKMKTRKVAGHEITLAEGVRYCAMRPIGPPPLRFSCRISRAGIGNRAVRWEGWFSRT